MKTKPMAAGIAALITATTGGQAMAQPSEASSALRKTYVHGQVGLGGGADSLAGTAALAVGRDVGFPVNIEGEFVVLGYDEGEDQDDGSLVGVFVSAAAGQRSPARLAPYGAVGAGLVNATRATDSFDVENADQMAFALRAKGGVALRVTSGTYLTLEGAWTSSVGVEADRRERVENGPDRVTSEDLDVSLVTLQVGFRAAF